MDFTKANKSISFKAFFHKYYVNYVLYRVLPPDDIDIGLMMDYLDDDSAPRKELIREYMKNFDPIDLLLIRMF